MNNNTLIIEKYGTFSWYFALEMNSNKVIVGTYPAIITNGVEIVIRNSYIYPTVFKKSLG